MALLEIVEDDPNERRLVLRAPEWTLLERARRALATIVAAALALGWSGLCEDTVFDDLLAIALLCSGLAFGVMCLPPEEVAEIRVDGVSRSFSVRTRGRWIWARRIHELAAHERLRVTSYGISPKGPAHPELGVELVLEPDGVGRGAGSRRKLPITGVVRLDRRDELEALAHRLASLLGRKVRAVAEDLRWYSCELGEHGEEPRAAKLAFGYRETGATRLDVSRGRSFEAPRRAAPPIESVDGSELRSRFRREGEQVTVEPEQPSRRLWIGLAIATIACAAIGAWGVSIDQRVVAVTIGALLPFGVLLSAGLIALVYRIVIVSPFRALMWMLGGERALLPRSPRLAATSGFTLEGDTLRRRRFALWPTTLRRGSAGLLVLVDRRRSWQRKGSNRTQHRSWRELWLFERGRWALLTRSRATTTPHAGACPTLDAVAFELGRRLDLPVRAALD